MLIVNADDYGKDRGTTDRILLCHKSGRITSATAMMFMADSDRAARIAADNRIETGLHLNLTDPFVGNCGSRLQRCQERVSGYLRRSRVSLLLFNPFLKDEFDYTCKSQWERFEKLYRRLPSHVDGHRHMHVCANVLFSGIIPESYRVRRTFHFVRGEKGFWNRMVRKLLDRYIQFRFTCTDYFVSIKPFENRDRIRRIAGLGRESNVEMMVHPDQDNEFVFLMSNEYRDITSDTRTGTYSMLKPDGKKGTPVQSEPQWTIGRK